MLILAVDTSQSSCSVAIADGTSLLYEQIERTPSKQAELLIPMMEDALEKCTLSYSDLDMLISTIGPGSFTGLRIGIAAMQSLELAVSAGGYGLSTLQCLAYSQQSCSEHPSITALIDARRGEYYAQSFERDTLLAVDTPRLIAYDELDGYLLTLEHPTQIVSNNAELDRAITTELHARDAAKLAAFLNQNLQPLPALHPLYIRKPDATPNPNRLIV